jgi:transketolase
LFYVPDEVNRHFHRAFQNGCEAEEEWNSKFLLYEKQYPDLAHELKQLINNELPDGWDNEIPQFPADTKGMATRSASGKVMNSFCSKLPGFIGGSADLNPSTFTELKDTGNFGSPAILNIDLQGSVGGGWSYAGRNIFFGVREHAMGTILNGLAVHGGILPFGATFLTFSDYMRPPIRLAALMEAHAVFIFTHDSIGLGEDGPTHQSVEHVAALRAIPQLIVIRPGDANETAEAWRTAVKAKGPVVLILSRQNVATLDRKKFAPAEGLSRGAYILSDTAKKKPQIILIATGSEVDLIAAAKEKLEERNIAVRLVSMPSWELFEAQPDDYKETVLPKSITARLAVEAGITLGWEKYTGAEGDVIGINHFGASAPGPVVMEKFGFTVENVINHALALIEKIKQK